MRNLGPLLVLLVLSPLVDAQTVTPNESMTVNASPRRVGMNIGDVNWYSNGNIYKNIIGQNNPTFEPLEDRRIYALAANGTTTSFTSPINFDNYPANYWAGANFAIIYGQSAGAEVGCTGTIASNTGPNWPGGGGTSPVFTLSAPCAAALSIGDIVVVNETRFPTIESDWENGFNGFLVQSSGGGKLESDTTDLCTTCGSQALLMDATSGTSAIGELWDSDNNNIWVMMNGTYQITFNAKTVSGSPALSITANRSSTGGFSCGPYTPTLTGSWASYTETCTASETKSGTAVGTAQVNFSVSGGAIYLDNVAIQKTSGLDATNTSAWRDEVIADLRLLSPGTLRYWITHQNGISVDNWTRPDYARSPSNSGTRAYAQPAFEGKTMPSLEDYLAICQLIGAEPYLEVPVTWQAADFSNFIEFLAGPSTDGAYGARRAALGQTAPWTTVFNTIHLDFCNECWNTGFIGEALPFRSNAPSGTNFNGLYYDYAHTMYLALAAMRGNSNFNASKFELIANAQTAQTFGWDFFLANAPAGGAPDTIEINAYYYNTIGQFASDAQIWTPEVVDIYNRTVNTSDPYNFNQSLADYQSQHTCGAAGTTTCKVSTYEWGQGTIAGSVTQTIQDEVNAGSGDIVAAALLPLLNMQVWPAIGNQNRFAFNEFNNGGSNSNTAKLWGAIVDAGGATNNVRPAFQAIELINKSIIGTMFSCPVSGTNTFNFSADTSNGSTVPPGVPATSNVPLVFAYCFKSGTSRSMVLINTDLASTHTITLAGGNIPTGTVTTRQLAPSSPDLLNEAHTGTATNTATMATSLTSSSGAASSTVSLPPYSVTALDYAAGTSSINFSGKIILSGKTTLQ
jgi:hypothetical protein